jgi:hypothetical protein
MSQTLIGAQKIASKKLGLTLEEYTQKRTSGLKWCTKCRIWKSINMFSKDGSRGDKINPKCKECAYQKHPRKKVRTNDMKLYNEYQYHNDLDNRLDYQKQRRSRFRMVVGIDWQKTVSSYNDNQIKTRVRNQLIRIALIILLGEKCVKCGFNSDIRALQVDHIKGGGTKEVRDFGGNITKMWKFYLENPELAIKTLQTLCANCNTIKRYENNENVKTSPTDEKIMEIRNIIKCEVNIIG